MNWNLMSKLLLLFYLSVMIKQMFKFVKILMKTNNIIINLLTFIKHKNLLKYEKR